MATIDNHNTNVSAITTTVSRKVIGVLVEIRMCITLDNSTIKIRDNITNRVITDIMAARVTIGNSTSLTVESPINTNEGMTPNR